MVKLPHHIVWPGLVVTLLGGSVLIGVVTMTLAAGDSSFAIEPDYYNRALAWDETAEKQRASDALGWACDISLADAADALGDRMLTVVLTDADGAAIEDASVSMQAFHKAASSERPTYRFDHVGQGAYATQIRAPREGAWQLDLTATRGDDRFMKSTQFWVFP